MSTLIVPILKIEKIVPHPNADRLEVVQIDGWECIVGKDQFKVGDKAVYFPIDCVIPNDLEEVMFANSKVKPHHGRIKTIRIRGQISQGLLYSANKLLTKDYAEKTNVAEVLKIKKYEPPAPTWAGMSGPSNKAKVRTGNKNFKRYTGIENVKWHTALFKETDQVCVTEKIHGTNFRAGWVAVTGWWPKLLAKVNLHSGYEFVFGSHNVQLKPREGGGVYQEITERYDLKNKLKHGEVIYGEIYGDGVQKGYAYGLKSQTELVAFDLMVDGKFVDTYRFMAECWNKDIPQVPNLYRGPYSKALLEKYTQGPSVLDPKTKVREGCVIKLLNEGLKVEGTEEVLGRKIVKSINPEYLLGDQTDYH